MRKELEIIEKIEAYLEGRLSPAETQQFETQLAADPVLRDQVELQRQLITGIDRASLKEQVLTAKKRYILRRRIIQWGLGILFVLLLTLTFLYFKTHSKGSLAIAPETNTPGHISKTQKTDTTGQPQVSLPTDSTTRTATAGIDWDNKDDSASESYMINSARDTVIETKTGMLLSILARTFLTGDHHAATGQIQLLLREALDPARIMKTGLSTRSGQQLLSTGGMFFLDAKEQDHRLYIDSTRAILTQIPAAMDQYNMQLYKGRRTSNGIIDWVDPRPLEHGLVPMDIRKLDFYPPHYLDSLRKWGCGNRGRRYTDSLYYSLAAGINYAPSSYEGDGPKREIPQGRDTSYAHPKPCGLTPTKIKTIWSQPFQNTILATREFEQRLHWLHLAGNDKLLDLYVDHLSWALSDIDSVVATQLTGEAKGIFRLFAAHHDGKINNTSPQFKQLASYYRTRTQAYTDAIAKTQREFWDKQKVLDDTAALKTARHQEDAWQRHLQNFKEEFAINMKEACHQLGITEPVNPAPPAQTVYTAPITSTGWHNIDKLLSISTSTRTTLDYTDTATGKKTIIRYNAASFQIADWKNYDRLYVYLLPNQLSSFLLVSGVDDNYTESLNELMKYDLVCVAYKGEKSWYYHQSNIQSGPHTNIQLNAISGEELTRQLNRAGSMTQAADLQKENSFFEFDIQDQQRRRHIDELLELRKRLIRLIFPCNEDVFELK